MRELSDELGLDRKTVKIWFQNKRQYYRKKTSSHSDEVAYPSVDEYLMYRDISSSEVLQPPPTMTSTGRKVFSDIGANLDIMDTNDENMEEGSQSHDGSEHEGDVYNDGEIITVRMGDDMGEGQQSPGRGRLIRGSDGFR